MADENKIAGEVISDDELEKVSGGTFNKNRYNKCDYWDAGIQVIDHFFAKDEFIWNNENIGYTNANAVTFFKRQTGKIPQSVKEAMDYKRTHHDAYQYEEGKSDFKDFVTFKRIHA
jgi:hypothetical protein